MPTHDWQRPVTDLGLTEPDRGWFAIFRFYAPTEPYFDRTWSLPDIEKII